MGKRFFLNVDECFISQSATIRDALAAISRCGALMACIVDSDRKLIGIVTDSDVRRGLLRGLTLESGVDQCASFSPVTAGIEATSEQLFDLAASRGIREIPLLDAKGRIEDIFVGVVRQERVDFDEQTLRSKPPLDVPMLILAGGKGTRLRSAVSDRPKPLAMVGGKPILQTLIDRAYHSGIRKFLVSVNYMADQVIGHLELPHYESLDISHVLEEEFLGTAGCLGLISERWSKSLLIANGDVLTSVPFDSVIMHHEGSGAAITCVVRPFNMTVPFGVVDIEDDRISSVREKPTYHHMVNTGIYVVDSSVKELVLSGEVLDMPTLISRVIEAGKKVSPFLMHEYWLDVGKPEDLAKANEEFNLIFGE